MKTYLVETESGLIQEELIHYDDALEVAVWMTHQYETKVIIRDYLGDIIKVLSWA